MYEDCLESPLDVVPLVFYATRWAYGIRSSLQRRKAARPPRGVSFGRRGFACALLNSSSNILVVVPSMLLADCGVGRSPIAAGHCGEPCGFRRMLRPREPALAVRSPFGYFYAAFAHRDSGHSGGPSRKHRVRQSDHLSNSRLGKIRRSVIPRRTVLNLFGTRTCPSAHSTFAFRSPWQCSLPRSRAYPRCRSRKAWARRRNAVVAEIDVRQETRRPRYIRPVALGNE